MARASDSRRWPAACSGAIPPSPSFTSWCVEMAYAIEPEYGLYIGNKFVAPASNARLESLSPLTGEVLCTVPDANAADVDAAVSAARAAWLGWFDAGPRKRQSLLM